MHRNQTKGVFRPPDDLPNMAGDDHAAQDGPGRLAGMPSLCRANAMFSAKESESTSSLLVLSSCGTRHSPRASSRRKRSHPHQPHPSPVDVRQPNGKGGVVVLTPSSQRRRTGTGRPASVSGAERAASSSMRTHFILSSSRVPRNISRSLTSARIAGNAWRTTSRGGSFRSCSAQRC